MPEIVRLGLDGILSRFGVSRRLATRLGALLSKRVGLSPAVLDEAKPDTALERLLLKRELLDAPDPASALASLAAEPEFAEFARETPLAVTKSEGFKVIVFEEELLAETGFAGAAEAEPALRLPVGLGAGLPSGGAFAAGAPAFSPEEVSRLRVEIFAGATGAEKVAALRKFAFVDAPEREKAAVFLQALADEDALLRAAAARGLQGLGLAPDAADACRLLAEGNEDEKQLACSRLSDLAPAAGEAELDAILMALLGELRGGGAGARGALEALTARAPRFGARRLCRPEIVKLLQEQLLRAGQEQLLVLRKAMAALDALSPGFVSGMLLDETARTSSPTYRAALVETLAVLDSASADPRLPPAAARTLLAIPADTGACLLIGNYLMSRGEAGCALLCESMARADVAHRRFLIRLFDNHLRSDALPPTARAAVAESCLLALDGGPEQVRGDILETRVCNGGGLPADLTRRVAAAFLREMPAYARPPLSLVMEDALRQLGPAAAETLLAALAERPGSADARILATVLGNIVGGIEKPTSEEARLAEEVARQLQKLSFGDQSGRDALHLALGNICAREWLDPRIGSLVCRTLLGRLEGGSRDAATVEALCLASCGRGADENGVRTAASIAMQHLRGKMPSPTLSVSEANGEDVFAVEGEVSVYSELIPACLRGLCRLGLAPRTPEPVRAEIVECLLGLWRDTVDFAVLWSPANVAQLTQILGALGASDAVGAAARLRIANSLARKAGEMIVLEALAGILETGRAEPELDRLAGSLALKLLELLEESGPGNQEDEEALCRLLARVAGRGALQVRGGGSERLLERALGALLQRLRRGVPGCLTHLCALRDRSALPARFKELLAREMAAFTSLKARDA